ncbi:nad-binding protein [Bipolaris maydis]|uniref:nad-binding protein n=1 Tax=Cochliobolus heterostrophus TaxID=5016 RepID=UPI0024DD7735|nr:nad-binding protein [Bipolaris maydis]
MSIKNVIIIGAGGNLGPSVLNAFLKESSFNTTVLSRQNSNSTFPPDVKVIHADYDSLESLQTAFKGQDAVVSLVGGMALGDQHKLIDAAIAAGVKRFLPSEFGSNTASKRAREIVPVFEAKFATVNYLKSREAEISWTGIIPGAFFDWGLKVGFLGFQSHSKTVNFFDEGEATFSTTNLHQIGVATVKALEHADLTKNQYVYISGFQTSQKEILAVAEKVTGTKWTLEKISTKDHIAQAREKLQKGEFSAIADLLQGLAFSKDEQLGDFSSLGLWNDKLGVPKESLEETVKAALSHVHCVQGNATPAASSTRPRRGTANQSLAAATIQRSSPEETRQSIHLTVKSSPNKLRQATGGAAPKAGVSRDNIVVGKRASRNSRVVQEVDSEEDEDEEEDEDVDEADAMDVDEDEDDNEDAQGDDDDEDMDAEGDEDDDMEDTPAPRIVVNTNRSAPIKPSAGTATKAQDKVEAKEMAMDDDDDEELSDPDSDLDDDEDAEGEDEDAEGEDDDDMGITPGADMDEEMDSDEELSRDQTPDVTKMTKRQRALVNDDTDGGLLALSNEAQKKKHLTAEEHAMRRAEMARRRKNLSEKRNEEEKLDTINRLLKKQPPKRGRKAAQDAPEDGPEEPEPERANPLFVRYIQNAKGTQLGVPEEWLQAPVGSMFAGDVAKAAQKPFSGKMVEEVA